MEKQTKILLGVAAVIAAYLILKPKKAAAQTELVSLKKSPTSDDRSVIIDNNDDYIPKRPYMPQVIESTPEELIRYYDIMKRKREEEQNCVCFRAPCNCGGGGVVLDTFMSNQVYES